MLRKLLYFGSNKKSIPHLSLLKYRPTWIYAHQKKPFPGYKPWVYIRDFTVLDIWYQITGLNEIKFCED